jgi:hypothetical protein
MMPSLTGLKTVSGSVNYAVYQGSWPWVPEFSTLTPNKTGKAKGLDISVAESEGKYGLAFTGYLTVKEDAEYTFELESDSGAHFRLHDATVIDDDFQRNGGAVRAKVRLAAGQHPFRLYYRHESGPARLVLKWSSPGFAPRKVAAEDLSLAAR